MTHGSLFSGIGGFDLAAEWMGWENKFHCEINPFCQKVLKYHFQNSIGYEDIKKTDFTKWNGAIDIVSGGFPCQPYSLAGKRKGKEDDRHLWPEMLRAIREIQPRWVVGENVLGLLNWDGGLVFHEVQTDLEAEGFIVFPYVLPACSVNAPHRRDRIWFVAYNNKCSKGSSGTSGSIESNRSRNNDEQESWSKQTEQYNRSLHLLRTAAYSDNAGNASQRSGINGNREKKGGEWEQLRFEHCRLSDERINTNASSIELQGRMHKNGTREAERYISTRNALTNEWQTWNNFPTQSPICSRDDGLSSELAGITFSKHRQESIKGYGNAIVPQVVYQIFKAIELFETR